MKSMIAAAFDQGQVPTIAVFSRATVPLGPYTLAQLVDAMQDYLDLNFVPVWGTPARLQLSNGFLPKAWAIVFLDDADVANALGYHDLTPEGFPLSKVFVKTSQRYGEKVSVTATHELAEMLVDPAINIVSTGPRGRFYAYEVCDACEALDFPVRGIPMSDFVYPSWFEGFRAPGSTKFDAMGAIDRPFKILRGGYMPIFRCYIGRWTQIFGSKAKEKAFKKEDRRQHRSVIRGNGGAKRKSRG